MAVELSKSAVERSGSGTGVDPYAEDEMPAALELFPYAEDEMPAALELSPYAEELSPAALELTPVCGRTFEARSVGE